MKNRLADPGLSPEATPCNRLLPQLLPDVTKPQLLKAAPTMDAKLTSKQGDALFGGLCIELGFCLRPEEIARLLKEPPDDIYSFTNRVFGAAGVNPERVESTVWWQVRQRVAAAFGSEAEPASPHPSIL